MCVIVDNNMRDRFFSVPIDPDLRPLWKWIDDRKGVLIIGGHLRNELYGSANASRALGEWIRTRRARDFEDVSPGAVDSETRLIADSAVCKSNDPHVIALARISGARLLCSGDKDLHTDFNNPQLIDNPRGRIYQNRKHRHLLIHGDECPLRAPAASDRRKGRK